MRRVIQTPQGPRSVPTWAQCYCVAQHMPKYAHPMPWEMPDGMELWLCPNTHHQVNLLWATYNKLDGPPNERTLQQFATFARRLCKMAWQQKMADDRKVKNPGLEIAREFQEDREYQIEYQQRIKRIEEEYL